MHYAANSLDRPLPPPLAIQPQWSNKIVPLVIDSEDAYVLGSGLGGRSTRKTTLVDEPWSY